MLAKTITQKSIGFPIIFIMGVFLLLWGAGNSIAYAQDAPATENANQQGNNNAGEQAGGEQGGGQGNANANQPKKPKAKDADSETMKLNANEYENNASKYSVLKENHPARDHYGIIDAKKYMDAITPRITGRLFDPVIKLRPTVPNLNDLATLGNPDSFYLLGLKYEMGADGMAKDWLQACHWYERAVQHSQPKAYAKLANCYTTGQGRDYNPVRAKSLYELGILNKDAKAMCGLGKLLYYNSDKPTEIQQALELCRSGFIKGDHQAAYDLYEIYRDGLKVSRSDYTAKSWLKSAVKKRNKNALVELSRLYKSGYLFKKSPNKAHEILRYLALDGDINSQFELANIYYDNMVNEGGVNTDILERAMFWYYTVQTHAKDPYLEKQSKERFMKMSRAVSADFVEMVEARYLNWTHRNAEQKKEKADNDGIMEIDRLIPVFDKIRKEKEEAARTPIDE